MHKKLEHTDLAAGTMLLADPFLTDPSFKRTMIFLAEHNDFGSIGFVLNKPSEYRLFEVLPDFPYCEATVYVGGPVDVRALQFLHTADLDLSDSLEITDGIYWGRNFDMLKQRIEEKVVTPDNVRLFAGYAGWTSGQLLREMHENSWVLRQASFDDVFALPEQYAWNLSIKQMGEKYAIFSFMPENPSHN